MSGDCLPDKVRYDANGCQDQQESLQVAMEPIMKIMLITDLEGVAGVAVDQQLGGCDNPHYRQAREFLAEEINAAIAGAREAGATEFVVFDGHGSGYDLALDASRLDPAAGMLLGPGGGYRYGDALEGIDAAFLIGQHPQHGPSGALEHTSAHLIYQGMWLNGLEVGEAGLHAALLGEAGIPLALATGDEQLVAEVEAFACGTIGVAVKRGLQRQFCLSVHPGKARQMIRAGACRAIRDRAGIRPWRPAAPPISLTVKFGSAALAAKYGPQNSGGSGQPANPLFPYLAIAGDTVTIAAASVAEACRRLDLMNRVV